MSKNVKSKKNNSKLKLVFKILSIIIAVLGVLFSLMNLLSVQTQVGIFHISPVLEILGVGLSIAILIITGIIIAFLWITYAIIKLILKLHSKYNNKVFIIIPLIVAATAVIIYLLYVYIL